VTTTVFVIHGRNASIAKGVEEFLQSIGLTPRSFEQAAQEVAATNGGSPYIGDVVHYALDNAAGILGVITPDEIGYLKPQFAEPGEADANPLGLARPNVPYEIGAALAINKEKVLLVEFGKCRGFSDIQGRHIVRMSSDTPKNRKLLMERLQAILPGRVDPTGDWTTAGDLTLHSDYYADRFRTWESQGRPAQLLLSSSDLEVAEGEAGEFDRLTLAFCLPSSLHSGHKIKGWTNLNAQNPRAAEIALEIILDPEYERPAYRAAYAAQKLSPAQRGYFLRRAKERELPPSARTIVDAVARDGIVSLIREREKQAPDIATRSKFRHVLWEIGFNEPRELVMPSQET
jgi:hypothetical protein